MDVLYLACPSGRTIEVASAVYGMYAKFCTNCCTPDSQHDCTELVAKNSPTQWVILKTTCDNKTGCSYQYEGAVISKCQLITPADYLHIFYKCLPGMKFYVYKFVKTLIRHSYEEPLREQ